jgi:hypothetical protein
LAIARRSSQRTLQVGPLFLGFPKKAGEESPFILEQSVLSNPFFGIEREIAPQ